MLFVKTPDAVKNGEKNKSTRSAIHNTTLALIQSYIALARKYHVDYLIDTYYDLGIGLPYERTQIRDEPNIFSLIKGNSKPMFKAYAEVHHCRVRAVTHKYLNDYREVLSDKNRSLLDDGITAFNVISSCINDRTSFGIAIGKMTDKRERFGYGLSW